jgi:CBS domain containing-hemolysin-like protein
MAVVVDESGRAEGLVTLEDIIEEVVGEIEDEYDGDGEIVPRVRKLGERNFVVNARIDLKTAETELGLAFPSGDYETLAGFLLKIAREIPADGAVIRHRGVTFTVKQANAQAIEDVRVTW